MDKLISISLTAKQWNVLEVALDRFIDDQVGDDSVESKNYAGRANIVKILMQKVLEADNGN
jgi:hypothetical protein